MAFNKNQPRDRNGRWTSGAPTQRLGKFLSKGNYGSGKPTVPMSQVMHIPGDKKRGKKRR